MSLKYRYNLKNCKVCKHPDCKEVDLLFLSKKINQEEAARRLDCTPAYYSVHINRDVQRHVNEAVAPAVGDVITTTLAQIQRIKSKIFPELIKRCEALLALPLDEVAEGRISKINKEVRKTAEFLARLEGDLRDSPLVNINMMNIKFVKLIESVNETICPMCQQKLTEKLKKLGIE